MRFQRLLGGLLFAAILIGGFDPQLLSLLFGDRSALAEALTRAPDLQAPAYPSFLREVARRTNRGESIAILVPMRHWKGGYSYAYFRASYFLAGRNVIPLVDADDTLHMDRLNDAELVAAWHMPPAVGPFAPVWSGNGGVLLRRTR